MADSERSTPLLDELKKGPWPSFVTQIEEMAGEKEECDQLLRLLERSYEEKIGHWKHGGIVGVMGYGGGVIGRYSDLQEDYPAIAHFHTLRVNQPSGWFYTSDALRTICDIWDRHGSGLTNMHGSTGDIILLGTTTDELEPTFEELTANDFDLGGSGSNVRTPSACVGPARCEWACYDTLDACHDITMTFQDELHRPFFPYKFKFKFSGCPNDCVASIARSDMSIIGTWRDDIRIDQDEVRAAAEAGMNIERDICGNCPTKCIEWDGNEMTIDNSNCVKCMHCINAMPKALRPGVDTGGRGQHAAGFRRVDERLKRRQLAGQGTGCVQPAGNCQDARSRECSGHSGAPVQPARCCLRRNTAIRPTTADSASIRPNPMCG